MTNKINFYSKVDHILEFQPVCTDFINCTKSLDTVGLKFSTWCCYCNVKTRISSGDEIANVNCFTRTSYTLCSIDMLNSCWHTDVHNQRWFWIL